MNEYGSGDGQLVIFMLAGRRGRVARGTAVLEAAWQLGEPIESICGGHLACRKFRVRLEEAGLAADTQGLTQEIRQVNYGSLETRLVALLGEG